MKKNNLSILLMVQSILILPLLFFAILASNFYSVFFAVFYIFAFLMFAAISVLSFFNNRANKTEIESIILKTTDKIAIYSVLFVLLSMNKISVLIVLILLFTELLISASKAIISVDLKKYDTYILVSLYMGTLVSFVTVGFPIFTNLALLTAVIFSVLCTIEIIKTFLAGVYEDEPITDESDIEYLNMEDEE